jgi:hypothetical protein
MREALKNSKAVWMVSVFSLGLIFCGVEDNPPEAKLAPIQPNQTSELAQAMRTMDSELVDLLAQHAQTDNWIGASLSPMDLTRLMPTDSSMLVQGYKAYALAFANHVGSFNENPSAETYSKVVIGCLSCHQQACPGPIERINKRKLEPFVQ